MTTFRLACGADDELLRSILRENAMPTWVELAITREPSFFAAENPCGEEWAVVAEERGEVIGMYTAAVLSLHVDGRPERVGYLGGLRVRPRFRRRIRHLREGYASIRPLAPVAGSVPWWLTVIAAENANARRLLESGRTGLPAYHPLGDYVTFAIATSRGRRHGLWRQATEADLPALVEFHNAEAARFQCSPVLDEAVVRGIGIERFLCSPQQNGMNAVACLWDQRAFKQIVARRYRGPIGALRGVYNAYARLARRIPLPREGSALEQTSLAFLAMSDEARATGRALLEELLAYCGTPAASVGLHAAHPLVPVVRGMKPIAYPARVYAVTFDGPPPRNTRPVQPEAALL